MLSVKLTDGNPHGAVMHYSTHLDPLQIYFQTTSTLKTKAIQAQQNYCPASVVIGLDEKNFVTLQMHGVVQIITHHAEIEKIASIHYAKFPETIKYRDDETIFLCFTPNWWRYSDYKTQPETIIENQ